MFATARNSPSPWSNGNARTGPTNETSPLVAMPPCSPLSSHSTTESGITRAGRYFGASAIAKLETVLVRSRRGELSSSGSVSSRLVRALTSGVATARLSLTTRTPL